MPYRSAFTCQNLKIDKCTWNCLFSSNRNQVIPANLQRYVSTNHSPLQCKTLPAHFDNNMMIYRLLNVIESKMNGGCAFRRA